MRRNIITIALSCVILILSLTHAHALYEEQAGQVDWHVSHIGAFSSLLLRPSEGGAVVATSENVLAAIGVAGANSGETRWRQVLPEGESLDALASYSKMRVLTLSSVGNAGFVRSWSTKDGGALVWDTALAAPEAVDETANITATNIAQQKKRVQGVDHIDTQRINPDAFLSSDVSTISDVTSDSKSDVVALRGNKVFLLNGVNGEIVWSWTKASFVGFRISIQDGKIIVVGQHKAGSIAVYILQGTDGKELSNKSVPFTPTPSKRNLQVIGGSLVLLNSKSLTVVSVLANSKNSKDVVIDLSKEGVSSAVSHLELLGSTDAASYIAIFAATEQLVFELRDGALKKVNSFSGKPNEDVELAIAIDESGKSADIVRAVLVKGRLTVQVFPVLSATAIGTLVENQPFGGRGGLKSLWVDGAAKKNTARVIIAAVDDSVTLFHQGQAQWTREEALASMTRLQYVELPAGSDDVDDSSSGSYPNFFQRLFPQLKSVIGAVVGLVNPSLAVSKAKGLVSQVQSTIEALQGNTAASRSEFAPSSFARPLSSGDASNMLQQDHFGFRKLLLASTASGKIYALESESGKVVWSRFLRVNDEDNEADEHVAPVWKVHVVSHHEAVAIVHEDGKSHLIAFNPLTGESIKGASMDVDFIIATSVVLPFIDSHNRRILLVASAGAEKVKVFPNSDEVRSLVASKAPSVFFYAVDIDEQVLQGFNLKASGKDGQQITAVPSWTARFPAEQERIVSIAGRAPNEVSHSSVRVLGGGDGGYLYKYLNPNLLAIATIRSVDPAAVANLRVVPSLKRTTDPSVNLYLLDTITGTILEKFVHRGCEGPVTVLQTENQVIYHYFNAAAHQYEVSSVELYETRDGTSTTGAPIGSSGVVPNGGSIFDGLTLASLGSIGRSAVEPFNSFEEPAPQSIQQTFTFRSAIKSLAVTQTRRGITSKELLIGLQSDQLYSLPRMLVDPRRPVGEPSQLDRMEGLIPYSSELPIDPLRIVSHSYTIGHLKAITSSHALLESTSLVCAYGIDLFCIRLSPSQTFDLLNEDFNSPFLIATVTAVFIAIVFTRRLARAKELKAAWK